MGRLGGAEEVVLAVEGSGVAMVVVGVGVVRVVMRRDGMGGVWGIGYMSDAVGACACAVCW